MMGHTSQLNSGNLLSVDKSKIISENIRAGVVLFEGTVHEVIGTAIVMEPKTFLADYGIEFPISEIAWSGNGASGISATAVSTSTPAFDITQFRSALFLGCELVTRMGACDVMGYRCAVVKDGSVIASASGLNAAIDIENINGLVTFQFSCTFKQVQYGQNWENNKCAGQAKFTNVCLS